MPGSSPVRSWTERIFIDVTGQMLSQRVKMKLTIVTWPSSSWRVSCALV